MLGAQGSCMCISGPSDQADSWPGDSAKCAIRVGVP